MGKGKAKIEIKKIESLQARNVCFTKRRQGLFKKAEEIGRLFPQVQIAAVVFSPAGNPYVFGDPHALLNYASQLEKSINALLRSEEEEESMDSAPVEITASNPSTVTDSTPQEITETGDMASNPSTATYFTMEEVTENKNTRLCAQDIASSDSDFLAADFDGLDEERFVNQFLNFD